MFQLKCHQYWPIDEGHTVVYGAIRVHMRSVNHCQAWIERIMNVQHAEVRKTPLISLKGLFQLFLGPVHTGPDKFVNA